MKIKIIGTSHIAKQSVEEIKKAVAEFKPEIIAVELDLERAAALMDEKKRKIPWRELRHIGVKGYAFAKIGQYVQQKLGKSVGVAPGSEMKAALELARKLSLKVELIDQPIRITLRKFSQSFTWKERGRFCGDLILGLITPQRQMRRWGFTQFDLRKVPKEEVIIQLMNVMKERYPSVYQTLVEDRNQYMVKKIIELLRTEKDKRILVIVGAGHKKGMEELLLKVDVV